MGGEAGVDKTSGENWWAKGLLFENCNCQFVCPAHFSFKQLCTHENCIGHWSIHIDEGKFDGNSLDDLNVIILYHSPQLMFNGGWTEALYIDHRADTNQRAAIEKILTGKVGGPWEILSRFVSKRLETRYLPIHFEDQGRSKKMWADGFFETSIQSLRGTDRTREVVLENLFNQIHAKTQVLATGASRFADGEMVLDTEGTHALFSQFSWSA